MNEIPDNSKNINYKLFVLDPLSIIIKLAILSNKPNGTKFRVQDNVMYLHHIYYMSGLWKTLKTELKVRELRSASLNPPSLFLVCFFT